MNVLRPQQRKSVRSLLHGFDRYRYRVSGHAPTVPPSLQSYTKMTKKDAFTSSITLAKCANTSTPFSQVGGLVERRRRPGSYTPGLYLKGIRERSSIRTNFACKCR
jgi:hypothetical protein